MIESKLKKYLKEKQDFIDNETWMCFLWSEDDKQVNEIVVEFCIGDCRIGYYIDRILQEAKYRCFSNAEVIKVVKELKQIHYRLKDNK